jgi:hypothetical protein
MISSVNALTGRLDCTEAILAQQRPAWLPALAGLVVVFGLVGGSPLDVAPILVAVVAGAAGGVVFTGATNYWIVARSGDRVVLARSRKLTAKAVEIVHEYDAPIPLTSRSAVFSRAVNLAGRELYVARQFDRRLRQITGSDENAPPAPFR